MSSPRRIVSVCLLLSSMLLSFASPFAGSGPTLSLAGPTPAPPWPQTDLVSLDTCSGQKTINAPLGYGADDQVSSTITLSCAPAGSRVTQVDVTVELDHDCPWDLNIRLDHLPRSTFLQTRDCEREGGDPNPTFSDRHYFTGTDPNGEWKVVFTDWCRGECLGQANSWSIVVHYDRPTETPVTPSLTPVTPSLTPVTPGVTRTLTPSLTPTPITPQPTAEPGCEHLVAAFDYEVICPVYATVRFSDASTSARGDPIESWYWEFGDGRTSSWQDPLSIILQEGYHQVRLTVRTSGGCEGSVTQVIRIVPAAFLVQVERASPSGPVYVGDEVTYRILASNEGFPTCAGGVWFRFDDDEFSFVSANPLASISLGWTGGHHDVAWKITAPFAAEETRQYTVTLRALDGTGDGTLSLAWAMVDYADSSDTWCQIHRDVYVPDMVLPRPSPLTMTKTLVDPTGGVANVGDIVEFEVCLENPNAEPVSVSNLDDLFPWADFDLVSASPTGYVSIILGSHTYVSWPTQTVPAGAGLVYRVRLRTKRPGTLVNCAEYPLPISDEVLPPEQASLATHRACATVEVRPVEVRAFVVDKHFTVPDTWSNQRIAYVGDYVVFYTYWRNLGTERPIYLQLVDMGPGAVGAGWFPIKRDLHQDASSPGEEVCALAFPARAPACPAVNTAEWTVTWPDGTQETQSASDWIYVLEPGTIPEGLAVEKTLLSPTAGAVVSDTLKFRIKVTNVSGDTLTNVTLTETYDPDCMSSVASFPWSTSSPGMIISTNLGSLVPGGWLVVHVTFHAETPCPKAMNCVQATAQTPGGDTLVGVDCAEAPIGGDVPALVITKRRTSANPAPVGAYIDWEITVTNLGNATATSVPLHDAYQADWLQFDSASPMPDSVDLANGRLDWNDLGPLAPGASHTVTLLLKAVKAGQAAQNCAETTFTLGGQPETRSDCDTVDIVAQGPGIQVQKVRTWPEDHVALGVGSTVAFSVTVRNVGTVPLSDIVVTDLFEPNCIAYLPMPQDLAKTPTAGQLVWDGPALGPGEQLSREVLFRVTSACAPQYNCVRASGKGPTGQRVEDEACAPLNGEVAEPGVTVRKRAVGLTRLPTVGDPITFEIVVQNTGNTPLIQVPLQEVYVVECLEYITANPPPDWMSAGKERLRWLDLGPLLPGEAHTVYVVMRALQDCWPLENCAATVALDVGQRQLTAMDCTEVWVMAGQDWPLYLPLVYKSVVVP